jgi:hypothetical protein
MSSKETTLYRECVIFIIMLLAFSQSIHSVNFFGKVSSASTSDLPNVTVSIASISDPEMIEEYTFTDEKGEYSLEYKGKADSVLIIVSGITVDNQSKKVPAITQRVDFLVSEKVHKIKEIVIKSDKIWIEQDTINYLVSSFSQTGDQNIGDVMKRMPGITVEEDGEIKYNGKSINKFYIENLDLLKGQYGIATNNLQPKDIATVQVLEKHQPIKALKDIKSPNSASINLKLKEGAKGVLKINPYLGLGVMPFLWDAGIMGMYFGKEKQFIGTYKTCNTGTDLSRELKSFDDTYFFDILTQVAIIKPSMPNIKRTRSLFHDSHTLSLNSLIKDKRDQQWNFNISYVYDDEYRDGLATSNYFLNPDSTLTIQESSHSTSRLNLIKAQWSLMVNKDNRYLSHTINVNGSWKNETGRINESSTQINQKLNTPELAISDEIYSIKKRGGTEYRNFHCITTFQSNQQNLIVNPGLFENFFKTGTGTFNTYQIARWNQFQNKIDLKLLTTRLHAISIDIIGFINTDMSLLNNRLEFNNLSSASINLTRDSMQVQLDKFGSLVLLTPLIYWKNQKWDVSFSSPIQNQLIWISHDKTANSSFYHKLNINPSLDIKYKANDKNDLHLKFNQNNQPGDFRNLASGIMLNNYRNLRKFSQQYLHYTSSNLNIDWAYRNILKMLFCSSEIGISNIQTNISTNLKYYDKLAIFEYIDKKNKSSIKFINGQISKGLEKASCNLTLKTSLSKYTSSQQIQGVDRNFSNNTLNIEFIGSAKPTGWLTIEEKSQWINNINKIEERSQNTIINTMNNTLNLSFIPFNKNVFKLSCEHYYNNIDRQGNSKNRFFADAEYQLPLKKWMVIFSLTNIFNTKTYITSYLENTSSYYHIYQIRPIEFLIKAKLNL